MAVPVPPKGRAATAPSAAVGLRVFLRFQSMIMLVLSFVWVVVQHNNNNGLQEHGTSISGGGRANNDDGPEEKYLQQLRNSSYARPSSITGYSRATTTRRDKMTPLSCSNVLAGPLAKSDPNMGVIHKRRTTTNPPFTISLHNETVDRTRWAIMEYGFYYEKFITKHAGDLLIANSTRVPKDSIFVDVGMNIGWFSLWAAAMGRDVVAFEPNPMNYHRMCQSVNLNGWIKNETEGLQSAEKATGARGEKEEEKDPNIKIFGYGVGESPSVLSLMHNPINLLELVPFTLVVKGR